MKRDDSHLLRVYYYSSLYDQNELGQQLLQLENSQVNSSPLYLGLKEKVC